jgi:hypothetical protein
VNTPHKGDDDDDDDNDNNLCWVYVSVFSAS